MQPTCYGGVVGEHVWNLRNFKTPQSVRRVGEHIRPGDLDVNVRKTKHLTNYRAKPSETTDSLPPPRDMSLDDCIEFLAEDELLEVTPESLRMRKRILDSEKRLKERKRVEKLIAG